jgi:outer membrane protein assembly factor BamB
MSFAQDWPQWRGPNRDGAAAAAIGPKNWPEKLRQLWTMKVGEGHSSPVVSGTRVFQFARTGNNEVLYGFDLASGKKLFEYAYEAPYEMNPAARAHGKGPKSTPLVSGGRVYAFGMSGVLSCVDAQNGKSLWRFDSQGKFKQTAPLFGVAMSPIIHQGRLIVHLGTDDDGAITAFDPATGKIQWQTKGLGPAYSSPVVAGAQIVTFAADKMFGLRATDGNVLWQFPFTTPYSQNSVTPFVFGDTVIYSGLAQPVSAIRIAGASPQKVWENKEMGMYMNSPVLAAGLLHGLSHRNKGQLFSLDPKTGKTVWTGEARLADNAALIARGDLVFCLTTESELHLLRASARGLEPVRKYSVANSPTWAHPVILSERILVKDLDSLALWTA